MDESRPQPAIPRKSASARPDVAIHLYEPGDGGLDRVAIHLANGFAARGLTTEIWLTRAEGASRHLLSDSVTIRMIPGMKAPRGLALATQIPVLRQMIRQVRPRVMLSAGNQSNPVIALACMGSDTAAIGKITNPIIRPGQTGFGARWRMMRFRKVTGWSAAMVSLGAGEVDMLAALWPESADKLHFLPLPTVTAPMAAIGAARLSNPPARPDGGPVQLLSIGRLAFQKDPETMLRALALVRTVDWRMTMVGDGPLRGEAEMLAQELGIADRVHFAGYVADPAPFLEAADFLILSSRWEGLCAVAMEALACGCGVVATNCSPSLTALLAQTECPVPVPVEDAHALARSIDHAVTHPAPLPQLIAAAAPYAMDAAIDAHIALFDQLTEKRAVR